MDGHLAQLLTVQVNAGQLQAVDELAVAQLVGHEGRADACDPECAELALLLFPATELIGLRLEDRLIGLTTSGTPCAEETLRALEQLLGAGLTDLCSLDACHG